MIYAAGLPFVYIDQLLVARIRSVYRHTAGLLARRSTYMRRPSRVLPSDLLGFIPRTLAHSNSLTENEGSRCSKESSHLVGPSLQHILPAYSDEFAQVLHLFPF